MAHPKPSPDLKTYKGNCHCECNCSFCFKKGYKWIFPEAGYLFVEKGDGSLVEYESGGSSMRDMFCPKCGTGIMGWGHGGASGVAVNARALQDVDIWALKVDKYDGAPHETTHEQIPFTGPEPPAEIENSKMYTGSCHCGAVTMALKTKGPLSDEVEIIGECDCSICARLGRVLTYRPPAQISIVLAPGTKLSSYAFAERVYEHKFCPVCGVAVYVYDTAENEKGVNLRCFEGVEWSEFETYKHRGSTTEPLYVVPQ